MHEEKQVAEILLRLKAVALSTEPPFTWASGLRAPIYCDNRLIISNVEERGRVINAFLRLMEVHGLYPDVIAGTATAGIPHAAWIADRLQKPMVYIRGSQKGHGKQNQIEGFAPRGSKAVVVEDLISTGGSSIRAAEALKAEGVEVLAVVAIFSYQLVQAEKAFSHAALPYYSISNLAALLQVAESGGVLQGNHAASIARWRQDPKAWSDAFGSAGG